MRTYLHKPALFAITLLIAKLFLVNNSSAQTPLYSQNFGTGTSLPAGWSSSPASGNGEWIVDNGTNSSGYTGVSGGSNVWHTYNSPGTGTLTFSNNLSTVGYTNITVLWGSRRFGNNVSTFQYSIDGTTWNTVSFTENTGTLGTWMLVNGGTRITLPANAAGVTNLRFRWTHVSTGNFTFNNYRIDDFTVEGTIACPPTITASATKSDITCFNTNTGFITISLPATGTSPFQYSIDNGTHYFSADGPLGYISGAPAPSFDAANRKFYNLPANTYQIRVKDNNGCESKPVQ